MPVPKYDELFNPLLTALHELGGSAKIKRIEEQVAKILNLTPEETNEMHSGNRTKLAYRLAWSSNYLKRYGLVDKSNRGVWSLTEKGKKIKMVDKDEVSHIVKTLDQEMARLRAGERDIEPINMKELLNKLKFEKFKYEPHFLTNPGVRVKDILDCAENSWVLPNFQRYYDWEKEDVRAFLQSIFNDYFVGSLLLWKINKAPEIGTFPIEGVRKNIEEPEAIILDGQQRITSLYYAIKSPEIKDDKIKSYFYINFKNFFENKSKDVVVPLNRKYSIKESVQYLLFPFYALENHISWIREFEDFYEKEDVDKRKLKELVRIIQDRILLVWQQFQIPKIVLPSSMKLPHVVDIFENINTKGKQLDAFDLLIAASSKHNIDLRKRWEESAKKYSELPRYSKKTNNKIRMYIIQSISLLHHPTRSCKKSDILELYEQVYKVRDGKDPKIFEKHWEEMSKSIQLAIKKLEDLKDGFGVKDEAHVPFMSVIPILAALIKEVESRDNKHECNKKINQWYWSVVFNEAYSSAVDSQLTSDFKELKEWFSDDSKVPKNIEAARMSLNGLNLRKVNTFSSAVFRGVLSILAVKGSRDLQTGEMVNDRNDYHKDHIFPRVKAEQYTKYTNIKRDIDSILNRAWLTNSTNESKGSKDPKLYFEEFKKRYKGNKENYLNVLESHLIDNLAYNYLLNNDYENFLKEREHLIKDEIKKLIGWSEEDEVEEELEEMQELIKSSENQKLEFKSTFKKNIETGVSDETMKFSVIKTVSGFLNSSGGTLIIGYNEKAKKVTGLECDYELTKMKDKDSWELELYAYLESKIDRDIIKNNVTLEFSKIDGKDLATLKIRRSDKPIYIKKGDKKILFVRNRNKTENLEDPEEIHNYIEKHF